ncbi:MAG: hypothetical protein KDK10_15365 [Maritimibacter sp.]|nr:hypothetical protein [Maritimibacter sp.]
MSDTTKTPKLSRRDLAGLTAAATVLAAAPALGAQNRMNRALALCQSALGELQGATPNKGGHRKVAMEHLEYVISQIKLGIQAGES